MKPPTELAAKLWKVWERVGEHWSPYLKSAGLDLTRATQRTLSARLLAPIKKINFRQPGLEELSRDATRGIEPGDPARSLFYHVFASPHVQPARIPVSKYPTHAELEVIENFVYGVKPPKIDELVAKADRRPLAIVVFAYEYAPARDTVHKSHADLCFSRTGIARVGNKPAQYLPKERGYYPAKKGNRLDVHVVPTKFGAFVATLLPGMRGTIGPMFFDSSDAKRSFWTPLHKLFNGAECIAGMNIKLKWDFAHINEKLRKLHLAMQLKGIDTGWNANELQEFPFVIRNNLAGFNSKLGLIIPEVHDPLIEPAKAHRGKRKRFVGIPILESSKDSKALPVYAGGALQFDNPNGVPGFSSPAYVHCKHAIESNPKTQKQEIVYLPEKHPSTDLTHKIILQGGYEAANFVDWTGDGYVRATCTALEKALGGSKGETSLAAYSVLAQPDFFPEVKQQYLTEWWQHQCPVDLKNQIWPDKSVKPNSMAEARYPVNFTHSAAGFDGTDDTMTSITGMNRKLKDGWGRCDQIPKRESTLSYRATNLFAPGWDASYDFSRDAKSPMGTMHLANYGLGSPYPEDTLICAAEGAFWPGAVPDVTRFMVPWIMPSTTPILDGVAGWDGLPLPQLVARTKCTYRYRNQDRDDYVRLIWKKRFKYETFASVTLSEYIDRTMAMARLYQFEGVRAAADRAKFVVLSFRLANDGEFVDLKGIGWTAAQQSTFRIEYAYNNGRAPTAEAQNPAWSTIELTAKRVIFSAQNAVAFKEPPGSGAWKLKAFST